MSGRGAIYACFEPYIPMTHLIPNRLIIMNFVDFCEVTTFKLCLV